uniref:Uncharacterized protein n=1 Tax=Meloidogyne enterolobii TaxID=390850 RepID=A0A6V7WKD5_MELEN|nr:unnamed protein product [Meloidogyne enterolobii]
MIRFSLKINKLKHISEEHSELIKLKEEWLEIEEKLQNDNLQSEESISNKIKTISDFFYEKVLSNNELKSNEWWKKHVKTTINKMPKIFDEEMLTSFEKILETKNKLNELNVIFINYLNLNLIY